MSTQQPRFETEPDFLPKFSRHFAHQLNNPIGAISSCVFLIEDFIASAENGLLSTEAIRPFITAIREECDSMKSYVQEFSKFFSTNSILASPMDLQEFVATRITEMVHVGLPVHPADTEGPGDTQERCTILGDAGALQLVVRALVNDALAAGATSVTVGLRSSGEAELILTDNRKKKIDVAAWKSRIDSFVPRPGTGLGLTMPLVGKIVGLHGGSIAASEVEEGGAVVRILLPLAEAA